MTPSDYENYTGAIAQTVARAHTSRSDYLATHCLPNWYPFLADLTPEQKIYNREADLAVEIWTKFRAKLD